MLLSACRMTALCDKSSSAFDFKLFILFKSDSTFLLSCNHKHDITVLTATLVVGFWENTFTCSYLANVE